MFEKFELFWAKKRWARNNPRIQTCSITSLNEIGTRKRSPLYSSFKDQPKLYGWDDGRNGELFLKKKEIASCGLWYCIYAIRAFLTDSFADLTIHTPSRNLQENFYKRTKGGAYVCTWAYGLVSLTKLWLRWTYTSPPVIRQASTCFRLSARPNLLPWTGATTNCHVAEFPYHQSSKCMRTLNRKFNVFFVFPHGWWNSVTLRLDMVKI